MKARVWVIPSVLAMAPLACGGGEGAGPDATADASAAVDAEDGGPDGMMDAVPEASGIDIQFSERRVDVAPPDGALCITERNDLGAVVCREEGFPVGSGFLCLRYLCGADDGGASTEGCCRLVS
jgi:hypothetical protein